MPINHTPNSNSTVSRPPPRGHWVAYMNTDGKRVLNSTHPTKEAAARARFAAEVKHGTPHMPWSGPLAELQRDLLAATSLEIALAEQILAESRASKL